MADGRTITSADSVLMFSCPTLFSNPIQIQGYMADRAFENPPVDTGEFVRGVDGNLSAGWIPYNSSLVISLMPDSSSSDVFETLIEQERINRAKYQCGATIDLPSTGRRYTCIEGYQLSTVIIPSALRVLSGRPFGFIFKYITPSPIP